MTNWSDYNTLYTDLHMREMRAAAQRAHLVRQARGPRPLRRRVGQMLLTAGERLAR